MPRSWLKNMLAQTRIKLLKELEKRLEMSFHNLELLNQAFIHESYANEKKDLKLVSNERLEFLGDSVLSLSVTEYIYFRYPDAPEGELNKIRAAVVSRATLAEKAAFLQLGKYLLLSKGEAAGGGRERASLLSNAFEALLGVIFLDQGLKTVKNFIIGQLVETIEAAQRNELLRDYKSLLQELVQKEHKCCPVYEVVKEEGPEHCKVFAVQVALQDKVLGLGRGKSKKEAEQDAARQALTGLQT